MKVHTKKLKYNLMFILSSIGFLLFSLIFVDSSLMGPAIVLFINAIAITILYLFFASLKNENVVCDDTEVRLQYKNNVVKSLNLYDIISIYLEEDYSAPYSKRTPIKPKIIYSISTKDSSINLAQSLFEKEEIISLVEYITSKNNSIDVDIDNLKKSERKRYDNYKQK